MAGPVGGTKKAQLFQSPTTFAGRFPKAEFGATQGEISRLRPGRIPFLVSVSVLSLPEEALLKRVYFLSPNA